MSNPQARLLKKYELLKRIHKNEEIRSKIYRMILKEDRPSFCWSAYSGKGIGSNAGRMEIERLKAKHKNIAIVKGIVSKANPSKELVDWPIHFENHLKWSDMRKVKYDHKWRDYQMDKTAQKSLAPSIKEVINQWGGLPDIQACTPNTAISSSAFSRLRAVQRTEPPFTSQESLPDIQHCPYMHMTPRHIRHVLQDRHVFFVDSPHSSKTSTSSGCLYPCLCTEDPIEGHGHVPLTTYEDLSTRGGKSTAYPMTSRTWISTAEKKIMDSLSSPYICNFDPKKNRGLIAAQGGYLVPLPQPDQIRSEKKRTRSQSRPSSTFYFVPPRRVLFASKTSARSSPPYLNLPEPGTESKTKQQVDGENRNVKSSAKFISPTASTATEVTSLPWSSTSKSVSASISAGKADDKTKSSGDMSTKTKSSKEGSKKDVSLKAKSSKDVSKKEASAKSKSSEESSKKDPAVKTKGSKEGSRKEESIKSKSSREGSKKETSIKRKGSGEGSRKDASIKAKSSQEGSRKDDVSLRK